MRWGLSPVFIYECLANSRRWQTYAIRSIGVAVLLAAVASIALKRMVVDPARAWRDYAALGEAYFYAIIGVELTLVMLAAPAATAGAICVDRARGTLAHMLVTELSDPEIVLGKLAARLLPILGLVACTWPVLSICSLLGGIDPTALTLAFAIILAVALLGCTMALALSVWARKPHEVVLVTYTFWTLVLLFWPIWFALSRVGWVGPPALWSLWANPYYLAFARYSAPHQDIFWGYFGFLALALGASCVFIILAVWRMRPVACRGNVDDRNEPTFGLTARLTRSLPSPSLDRNPVLWREWHRSRPSRWLLALMLLIGGSTGIACVVGAATIWATGADSVFRSPGAMVGIYGYVLQLIFGFLMLAAVAPLSMSEERQRGSLDLLAATALSTRTIVLGKWFGTLRLVLFLAIGPGLVGCALGTAYKTPSTIPPRTLPDYYERLTRGELLFSGCLLVATILVHGALIASIGLALGTWIKRQSRAIAASVGLAVMIIAGWPILIAASRMGMQGERMMCLSPVMVAGTFAAILSHRLIFYRDILWWITFWDIECMVLALGLVWLTVRTFDGCFGRIPERPKRVPVLSDVVVVLAALVGIGNLFGAIAIWVKGLGEWQLEDLGVFACSLLVTGGFLLLSALAPLSIARRATQHVPVLEPAEVILDRKIFARRWWETFRLVLALAIGPAFLAFALVTARMPVHVVPKVKALPGGLTERIETHGSGTTYVTTTDASGVATFRFPTDEEIAAATPAWTSPPRSGLSRTALIAVFTIPTYGAAFVSLGLALGIWFRGRAKAIAASVCLVLFVTVGWPILLFLCGDPTFPWGSTLASLPTALSVLLINIRREDVIAQTAGWVASCNLFFILLTIVVSALAIWALDRRSAAGPWRFEPRRRREAVAVGGGQHAVTPELIQPLARLDDE
jgi:ABC-type transport system involved in multi-copper enzyme maturation permease subunit